MKHLRQLIVSALALACLVQPALATWSIVVVNTKTGEVAVASATCLTNTNLIPDLPVVYPGIGAAAVQSARDPNGVRKLVIWDGFETGLTPQEILTAVSSIVSHPSRQYGIADLSNTPVTFTGTGAGEGKHEVAGIVGDLRYAIQGNVLVGDEPVDAAEFALLNTPGDLGQKLMAAMEAAAATGGDGRCSCDVNLPTSCGSPPAGTWKSAHTGFMIVARTGDAQGKCQVNSGCANGNYYLKRNSVGGLNDPDPVLDLRAKFDTWRAALSGRPDHILSIVSPGAESLLADGLSKTTVAVQLVDVDGAPLTTGGATLTLTNLSGAPAVTTPGPVVDHGDGSYEFTLTAGVVVGTDEWEIKVNDGIGNVRLYPPLEISADLGRGMHVGFSSISASQGGFVPLTLNLGPANAGQPYWFLASSTGTIPGTQLWWFPIPLNRGRVFNLSLHAPPGSPFVNTIGVLDANGRAEAGFMVAPGALTSFVGQRIDWSSVVTPPGSAIVSDPTGFDVVP